MFSKSFLTLLLFLFIFPALLEAQQYEHMRIAKIDLAAENLPPDMVFNPNAVRGRMQSKIGSLFSQNDFDCDLKMLAEEYDRVEPEIEIINGEIYISLQLWFKPTIRSLVFCGNQRVKSKKLKKALEIDVGAVFERENFIEQFNKVKALYVKKGYFEAELDYSIIPVTDCCNQIDIQIDIQEGRAGKIKKICLYGMTSCEESELLDLMVTKRYQLLMSWYSGRGVYHPDMIEHDRLQITNYFQNCGYADALVNVCIEESNECDRIVLVITVDKGELYSIGKLALCGNTLYSNEKIWEQFLFGMGSYYSPENIRDTVQAITDLYGSCGYIDASVDVQLALREDCLIYDVIVSIDEGEQYHVGLIQVFGNGCTQTKVILHESILCPGEIFDIRKLKGTEIRLTNTGYFSQVNVYAVQSQIEDLDGECRYRDVYIEVEETDTGSLGLFFGFSSLDRVFGGIELTERNFNIAGITRVVSCGPGALRGGGEFLNAKVNIGDRVTNYIVQWAKPYFLDTPWLLGVDVEKTDNRALSRAYEVKTYGGNIHALYVWNYYLKYDIYYRARHTRVSVRDSDNSLLDKEGKEQGFISAAGVALIYDSTNNPRRASCGFRSRLVYELAGIGGNFQFMKFAYLNSYYYPVSERGTLKFRADFQFIKTYGHTTPKTLPLSERFYLGGETTVRGYRNYIIGPLFAANEPRGGVSSMLLSEEYQYNILKNPCLDGFAFVDAGYISLSEFTLGRPAASVGFGIRVEVMRNMPLMMGIGWPIHPTAQFNGQTISTAQRFFFAVGGSF